MRRFVLAAAALPTVLIVLLATVLVALELDPVLDASSRWALKTFNPLVGASMDVDRVSGGVLTGIVADGFHIRSDEGHEMVRVRKIAGYVHLLPLLRSRVSIAGLDVVEPELIMTQRGDSTWDLIESFQGGAAESDTSSATTPITIRRLRVSNGHASLRFAGDADSTFRAWNVNTGVTGFSTKGNLSLRVDSLRALFQPPGAADTVRVAAELTVEDQTLELHDMSLVSAVSNVFGSGRVSIPGKDRHFEALDFSITATPLSLRDIQPFVHTLNPRATVTLDIRADGDGSAVDASVKAEFGDGGTITADAVLSPPGSRRIAYSVDAAIEQVDPSYVMALSPKASNKFTGSVRGSVRGSSLDSLGGSLELHLQPIRFASYSVQDLDAAVQLQRGFATVSASTTVNGSRMQLTGGGRFLDDVPTYDATLAFANLDVANLSDLSHRSNLTGRLTAVGTGLRFESAAARTTVRLQPSVWNDVDVPSARADANLDRGVLAFALSAAVSEGTLTSKGRVRLDGAEQFAISEMSLENVPVMRLLGDTTRSEVNARFSGSGTGFVPSSMSISATGTLMESVYDRHTLHEADVALTLADGALSLTGSASLTGGSTQFDISGRPFADQRRFNINRLHFQSLDLAKLSTSTAWATDLNGQLNGDIRIANGASRGSLSIQLDSSRVNRQTITEGRIDGTLEDGVVAATFEVTTPLGRVAAVADARPFDDPPEFKFSRGVFNRINVGEITARQGLDTDLNGRFDLTLRGAEADRLVADAALEITESRFNGERIDSGRVVIAADSGRYTTDAEFEFRQGDLSLAGQADVHDSEPFEFTGSATNVNIGSLLRPDSSSSSVTANLFVSGFGIRTGSASGIARLAVSPSTYGRIKLDVLTANATIDGKLLRVDTLSGRSNVALLSGSGLVALSADPALPSSDLTVHAEIVDLKPLHGIVPEVRRLLAEGSVTLSLSGEPGDVRFRADGQLTRIAYNDLRIGAVDARLVGSLDENRRVAAAEGRLEVVQLSLPTLSARETTIEVAYADDKVNYEATSTLDDRRDVRTSGVLDLREGDPQLTMNTLRLRLDKDRWQLLQPSTVSFGAEYRIQNFLLFSDTQQIAVDGFVDLDGDQSLILTIEQFRISGVADLLDYRGLDGTLNGYIDLSGPAAAPIITGSLTAVIRSLNRRVGDLSLDLNYSEQQLGINGRLRNDAGSALNIDGNLPMNLRLAPPDDEARAAGVGVRTAAAQGESTLRLNSDGFAIDWILPFLDPDYYSSIGGILTGQMDVRGTFSDPSLSGSATIANGSVGLAEFGVTFTGIRGDFSFRDNRILVDHLEAQSGSGTAIVTGSISLSDLTLGDFDLEISSEAFQAVNNREYRASAASDLRLTGSTRQPVLSGHVEVASADIFLADEIEEFAPVSLSIEDLQTVEQRFGIRISEDDTTTFSFYEALSMNLTVELSRNTWLRSKKNPTMDIQFTGDLEVQKKPGELAQVFGSIEVIPERSRIVQFGKSFKITKGALTYNGPITDPILDIQAEYDIRAWRNPESQVTITLTASGRFDDLDVELSSDPLMETTDIVSYIAFGRPASESLQLGGSGPGGSLATDLALGQIAGLIEDVAGTGLGLDVIEIEQQGLDARLTAGKYVHRRVYLAISQPLNLGSGSSSSTVSSTREITTEFELLQSLLLRVLSRRSSISVNVLWQYAY